MIEKRLLRIYSVKLDNTDDINNKKDDNKTVKNIRFIYELIILFKNLKFKEFFNYENNN